MKFNNHNDKIVLSHENAAASLATWWKACFLAPPWLLPLLPVLGGTLHTFNFDQVGFILLIGFVFSYFLLDLLRKKIVIDRVSIRNGLVELPVGDIAKIEIGRDRLKLPTMLRIEDRKQRSIKLYHRRLSADDIQTLVNTLQRMSPSCRIDPEVDALIRYKKVSLLPSLYDTSSTVSVPYHVDRAWEDIPGTLIRMLKAWSKFLGPFGAMFLFLPLSLMVLFVCYTPIYADWGAYHEHKQVYDVLIQAGQWWLRAQSTALTSGIELLRQMSINPIVLFLGWIVVSFGIFSIARSALGANRITMNATELSLDRWNYWFSYNVVTLVWSKVRSISLNRTKSIYAQQILTITTDESHTTELDLSGIDSADRQRFLNAIKRFAPHCEIEAEVHELLEPPTTDKSYTQLWLQSIALAPKGTNLKPIEKGTTLEDGRYDVIRKLGVGGQGAAYLCHDLTNQEQTSAPIVVLKEMLIPPYLSGVIRKSMIENFYAEANMLKNIDSPHVVKLIDYFVDERGAYLVLEHIEGQTLRQLVADKGPVDLKQANTLVDQMLEILKVLHENEIVHRDFTPDNLILRPDGTLKLIDFNVAQDESEGTTATIVGKHAYVPPEQFRGKPSAQSDLYAFGATVFYLMTAQDPEPITQSSLPDRLSDTAARLNDIIRSCTAVELKERAASVHDIVDRFPAADEKDNIDAGQIINIDSQRETVLKKQVAR